MRLLAGVVARCPNHSLTTAVISGFDARAMNAPSNVLSVMPENGMAALLLAKRPVIQLKWRMALICAAFGQEEFH